MINKENLWFVTLFSLILVLSVYYITMPNELLLNNNKKYPTNNKPVIKVKESELLLAMKVTKEEERLTLKENLQAKLIDATTSVEEKNSIYEQIKYLNLLIGKEEMLEKKLKDLYKVNSFIKQENNDIKVVAISDKHDTNLANDIMRSIQEEYKEKMYISVRFEKK